MNTNGGNSFIALPRSREPVAAGRWSCANQ